MLTPSAPRVVAITGGACGIGREIAHQLAATGARVIIGDLDAALTQADDLADTIATHQLDVTDTTSLATFVTDIQNEWGPIDVFINNAGLMWVGPFDAEPDTAAHRQIEVNLHGVMRGIKLVAPIMRRRGHGHIITIASAASMLAPPGEATYAATKHAIYGYLKAVRTELHGSGVNLSVIMPGVVDTALAAGTNTGPVSTLTPTDVAKAVAKTIQRPRFTVTLPRRIGLVTRLAAILPDAMQFRLLRAVVPNQVSTHPNLRAHYHHHLTD